MEKYSKFLLENGTATFTGDNLPSKTIQLGTDVKVEGWSTGIMSYNFVGSKRSLSFGAVGSGKGDYHVVVTTEDPATNEEEYIPITVGLIMDVHKVLKEDRTIPAGEKIEVEAKLGGSRKLRLKKQARRTKRNTRNNKRRKLRKLSTRRR